MSNKRPPLGHVVERATNGKGRPILRARCPHCAEEHIFGKAPVVTCPRTGHRLRLRIHKSRRPW